MSFCFKVEMRHEEFDEFAGKNMQRTALGWSCLICEHRSQEKNNVKRHIEARHVILPPLHCLVCNRKSKTSHSMRMHMKSAHNIVSQF